AAVLEALLPPWKVFSQESDYPAGFVEALRNLTELERAQLEGMSSPGAECLMKEWRNLSTDLHCGALWDGHFCWPVAAIGETLRQPCLQYHSSNNTIGSVLVPNSTVYVSRRCDENGIWKWDNITRIITECLGTDDFTQKWETREIIRYVLFIGSILSFLVLAFALLIFFYFKSIRCDRITIHIHFMVSLVLKNLVLMMVSQPYLLGEEFHYRRVDVSPVLAALVLQFNGNSSDVQQYRRAAKSTLILFPLLGITNLMFFFNPGGSGQAYYMMANAIIQPLQGILVSVLNCFLTTDVRAAVVMKNLTEFQRVELEGMSSPGAVCLMNEWRNLSTGPVLAALVGNLAFLVNITRVLFSKLQDNGSSSGDAQRYRRAAKSSLILFPLLGINNLIFFQPWWEWPGVLHDGKCYHSTFTGYPCIWPQLLSHN
ncbi:unnamed protein product, partial [Allacma fusca]